MIEVWSDANWVLCFYARTVVIMSKTDITVQRFDSVHIAREFMYRNVKYLLKLYQAAR